MAKENKKVEEKKEYANPILYLRKSKKGDHLYAFNVEAKPEATAEGLKETGDMVLGNGVESLIANLSEVQAIIDGKMEWCKVSVLSADASE